MGNEDLTWSQFSKGRRAVVSSFVQDRHAQRWPKDFISDLQCHPAIFVFRVDYLALQMHHNLGLLHHLLISSMERKWELHVTPSISSWDFGGKMLAQCHTCSLLAIRHSCTATNLPDRSVLLALLTFAFYPTVWSMDNYNHHVGVSCVACNVTEHDVNV